MRIYDIFVAKMRNYDIFVAKIYDYALIDSFWGFPRFIDSPTSYATLLGDYIASEDKVMTYHVNISRRVQFQKKAFVNQSNMYISRRVQQRDGEAVWVSWATNYPGMGLLLHSSMA